VSSVDQSLDGLQCVLQSKTFERSHTLRTLLLYLWEHRDHDVSEYAIAIDALGRKTDFEPKSDATVRVQLSRLRKRLREFYETEGSHLRFQIEIPLGTHNVQIVEMSNLSQELPPEAVPISTPSISVVQYLRSVPNLVLGFIVFLLLIGAGWIIWSQWVHRQNAKILTATQVSPFWRGVLDNGKPTRIVVPTPTFFLWGNSSTSQLMARDPEVNTFSKLDDSTRLAALKAQYGSPELAEAYTAAPDTFALLQLTRYFDLRGVQIPVSGTNDFSFESLDHENMIVLGTGRTLAPFHAYIKRLSFQLDAHEEAVIDQKPVSGKPARFEKIRESPTRQVSPGIVAVLPGSDSGTRIIVIMAGFNTSSLVAYLTSEDGLRELEKARKANGGGPFFEAVILSELNGTTPLKSWLAELKPYDPKG